MQYFNIKNTDLSISSLALGTWVFGGDCWGGVKEQDCIDTVSAAIDLGINLIDTAPIYGYGASESIVGKAIKGRRDKVVIATKCGLIGIGAHIKHNLDPESIRTEIEESLKRLKIDFIDIYQCHWPDQNTPIEETLGFLCKLQQEGKIKYIGVSNFDDKLLQRACDFTKIVTLQNQYSLLEREIEDKVLPVCRDLNVGVLTYGPLTGGILSGKYKTEPNFKPGDSRSFFYKCYKGEEFNKTKKKIDELEKFKRPLNQLAVNWVRQQAGIASVITGARNPEQIIQNAKAFEWYLSDEELMEISQVTK
ncbi:MAG: aldo/keto reductase [Candidatus Omnitrophica bacterium]|nr:aldo/keto reductase [Candidatus Omnitrophota bacterium]